MPVTQKRKEKIRQVIENRQKGLVIVLEDIHDPHNAAAVLRSADAFGVQEVCFIFDQEKPYNPKRVGKKTSSSANKWLDFHIFRSIKECVKYLKRRKYKIYASVVDDKVNSIYRTDFTKYVNIALLFGNEHRGLSQEAVDLADYRVYIPMKGMVESLNISVTCGIFLYEVSRQRKYSLKYSLSKSAKEKLYRDFCRR